MAAHGAEASLLVFAVSVLIGGIAIHLGASVALKSRDLGHAVLTAILGALAWTLVSYLFGAVDVPGRLASLVGLVVWVWVIGWRYRVGWLRASLIGVVAWIAALVVLALLSLFGVDGLAAYGVPGV